MDDRGSSPAPLSHRTAEPARAADPRRSGAAGIASPTEPPALPAANVDPAVEQSPSVDRPVLSAETEARPVLSAETEARPVLSAETEPRPVLMGMTPSVAEGPLPYRNGNLESAGCTAPQLRRFIKSRTYVPMHELRRRFAINGDDDEVTGVAIDAAHRIFVGLPPREGALLGELFRSGDVGYELSLDPISPMVVGVFPMRPVARG